MTRVLLIGFGNPGRGDDGLGPALVESLESSPPKGLELIGDYQLTIDLAYDIAPFETVVFADADRSGPAPFSLRTVAPEPPRSFTSHSQTPEGVLYTARALFGARSRGYLLGIRGYRFDSFSEVLSPDARSNLNASREFLINRLLPTGPANALGVDGKALRRLES